jgi:tetratricopeptide (TPR) repeat protein
MVTNLAMRLNVIGHYDEALANAEKGMQLDSGYQPAYVRAGEAYEALGIRDKAVEVYRLGATVAGPPGNEQAILVRANTLANNLDEARKVAQELERRAARGEVQKVTVAWAYSAMGERDRALQWLNRALDARDPLLRDSARTLQLKELRGDPGYEDLLRRLARGF